MSKRKPGFYFCELWRMNYYYCLGWSKKDFIAYCEKEFNYTPDLPPRGGKMVQLECDKGGRMVIWTSHKNDLSLFLHECIHAATYTLWRAGWKCDEYNDEPLTYLTQLIFEKGIKYTGIKGIV